LFSGASIWPAAYRSEPGKKPLLSGLPTERTPAAVAAAGTVSLISRRGLREGAAFGA